MEFNEIDFEFMDSEEIYDFGCNFLDNGDIDNAMKCFILAAEQGNMSAQSQLGDMYRDGKWVEASLDEVQFINREIEKNSRKGFIFSKSK